MNNLPKFFHRLRRENQENIKIGLLSDSFCLNENAKLIYAYLGINDEKIVSMIFALNESDDITEQFKKNIGFFADVSKDTPLEIASKIYDNQIDILIVLADNKIIREVLKYHSAPIQIAGATAVSLKNANDNSNAPIVDAIFGDEFIRATNKVDTIELNSSFCYLPFFGNTNIKKHPQTENIILGILYSKTDKKMPYWKTFAKILEKVPNAKILLFSKSFEDENSKTTAIKRLAWAGITEDKILFSAKNKNDFFADMDIFLDAYPTGEGATLINLLYMGTPVVSMTDIGKSILNSVGLAELGAVDENAYINAVAALCQDRELLKTLHENLRNIVENSLIMNTEVFTENIKNSVRAIFQYLVSLRENIPTPQEFKLFWNILCNMETLNENAFALLDRILLFKPADINILKHISMIVAYDNIDSVAQAAQIMPENSLYYNYLNGLIENDKKDFTKAEEFLLKAVEFKPADDTDGFIVSSAYHLLGNLYKAMGEMRKSADMHLLASKNTPSNHKSAEYERYSNYLLTLHYLNISPKEILEASKKYNELFVNIKKFSHEKKRKDRGKIRVGYISPDFRNHVVSSFAGAFFFSKNSERFEAYAYMLKRDDIISNAFKMTADKYRNLSELSYDDAAKVIYDDEIDILVDLAGHTADNGLPIMARKPAPIQISGIGYFSTTGLSEMDYFLVDKYTAPDTEDANFTEKLLRLPNSQFSFMHIMQTKYEIQGVAFEKNNYITFGSMNNSNKINDNVLYAWAKILDRTPNSKLLLKCGSYHDNEWRLNKERNRLKEAGIDLDRVILEGFSKDYLKEYNRIDIALDTFPYPGGGTTCDALMMGVPVVTLAGNSNHERFGKSILCNLKLNKLVANSVDEYIDIAENLAENKMGLKLMHLEIPNRMKKSVIMDQDKYMKDIEAVYEKIYGDWINLS